MPKKAPRVLKERIEFKIEKNIPIPDKLFQSKYPYAKMEIGDSFLIKTSKTIEQTNSSTSYAAKRLNMKFTSRTVDGGIRIWRKA